MIYYKVAKTKKDQMFIYSNKYAIACKSEAIAKKLCNFLNNNNNSNIAAWRLQDNEIYHVYEADQYDSQPFYQLSSYRDKISIKPFNYF